MQDVLHKLKSPKSLTETSASLALQTDGVSEMDPDPEPAGTRVDPPHLCLLIYIACGTQDIVFFSI